MIYIIPTDTCFWIACPIEDIDAYKTIYTLKKRPYDKPLAIMVEDFEYLERTTYIQKSQIDFLKSYRRPFTVLVETKRNFISELVPNKGKYKKTAFRVAHSALQKKLIKGVWPLFLTSANISGDIETYKVSELPFTESKKVQILADSDLEITLPSDIFEFRWNSNEVIYLRQY